MAKTCWPRLLQKSGWVPGIVGLFLLCGCTDNSGVLRVVVRHDADDMGRPLDQLTFRVEVNETGRSPRRGQVPETPAEAPLANEVRLRVLLPAAWIDKPLQLYLEGWGSGELLAQAEAARPKGMDEVWVTLHPLSRGDDAPTRDNTSIGEEGPDGGSPRDSGVEGSPNPPLATHAWRIMPAPPGPTLHALWGASADNIWAVGDRGTLRHFNGTSWRAVDSPTTAALRDLWGASQQDLLAVGGLAAQDGVDCAAAPVVLHFDGTDWSEQATPHNMPCLVGTWAGTGGPRWVIGGGSQLPWTSAGIASAWKETETGVGWDRTYFADLFLPDDPARERIVPQAIWGSEANDFWILSRWPLGIDAPTSPTQLFRNQHGYWARVEVETPSEALDIWGTGPEDIWVVGRRGLLFGRTWKWHPPQQAPTTEDLYGIWGSSPTNYWAVGDNGTILQYDGETWNLTASPVPSSLRAVWGSSPLDLWAAGEDGIILRYAIRPEEDALPRSPAAAHAQTVTRWGEHDVVEGVFSDPDGWRDLAHAVLTISQIFPASEQTVELYLMRGADDQTHYLYIKEHAPQHGLLSETQRDGPCQVNQTGAHLSSAWVDLDCALTEVVVENDTLRVRWALRFREGALPSGSIYGLSLWGRDVWGNHTGVRRIASLDQDPAGLQITLGSW